MNTSAPAPAAATRPNLRLASSKAAPGHELVTVLVDNQPYGNIILPMAMAAELIARVDGEPSHLPELTAEIIGGVRWCLSSLENPVDREFLEAYRPPDWTQSLIWLIVRADDEHRARLGRIYSGYVCAVAIALGANGLGELAALHTLVLQAAE